MKSITFGEYYTIEDIRKGTMNVISTDPEGTSMKVVLGDLGKKTGFTNADELSRHDGRIQFANSQDVQIQVLSYGNGSPSNPVGQKAIELCQKANDQLANCTAQYPNRFAGFAVLPINGSKAAAREFERYINDLGFKGTLIMRRTQDGFLDQDRYDIISRTAENLDVPTYLHPTPISSDVYQSYYKGNHPEVTTATFVCLGYGWHIDVSIRATHLALSGTFDCYSKLNMVIGYWGRFIPLFLERIDEALFAEHLNHPASYYFKNNFYTASGGMLAKPQFDLVRRKVGTDRILYAADHPYIEPEKLGVFLGELGLTDEEKEKISYTNGARLLGLSPNN